MITDGEVKEMVKELLVFGASFGRVHLKWNFPLLQCSSHCL